MAPPPSSIPRNAPSVTAAAFEKVVKAIGPDIPLMMHGSGDVLPHEVNLDAAGLVAELTAQYLARLVDAAVDAHNSLTDGAGGILPPASQRYRTPLAPPLFDRPAPPTMADNSADSTTTARKRKRRKAGVEYWDDPIPDPRIQNFEPPSPSDNDRWVGLAGVDFFETSRARRAFVTTPSVIGTQCFVFPICHDAQLYGRVMEVQSARRNLEPELVDTTVMDLVRTEGVKKKKPKSSKEKTEAGEENIADEEEEELGEEATWPMDPFLPTYRNEDIS